MFQEWVSFSFILLLALTLVVLSSVVIDSRLCQTLLYSGAAMDKQARDELGTSANKVILKDLPKPNVFKKKGFSLDLALVWLAFLRFGFALVCLGLWSKLLRKAWRGKQRSNPAIWRLGGWHFSKAKWDIQIRKRRSFLSRASNFQRFKEGFRKTKLPS